MGREIRRVPANWEHPRDEEGEHLPVHDKVYAEALKEWFEGLELWLENKHPAQQGEKKYPELFVPTARAYAEYEGDAPETRYYRDAFDAPADHYQVYQTVSEGTPVSPVFPSLEELKAWLLAEGYSPSAVERFVEYGSAPSGLFTPRTGFLTDIESCALLSPKPSHGSSAEMCE